MDPNPKTFPILSYVMSKFHSVSPRHVVGSVFDIEQPSSSSGASTPKEPAFDLADQMPRLTDPKIMASMRSAVADVAQVRSVLKTLGDRPDHETVDTAKAKLLEIESNIAEQLDEIALSSQPADLDGKEKERREAAEKERQAHKAVVSLDEMHEAYEMQLKDAEAKLTRIYEAAVAGRDVEEEEDVGSGEVPEEVNEEVVGILQEASGKGMERVDLSRRQLRLLPEAFGRLHGLVVLNLSSNQLEAIPDSIAGLQNIEELHLASNLLESLPDSIGLLHSLKILDVSGNKLVSLPDSICQCRSLVELDASFNALTYLPTNIGYELVNLRRLSIYLNKIRSLPTSIGEMKSLRILDVHFNELRGLPLAIGKLTNLEVLNLSSNFSDLKQLPNTLGDLTNLNELNLSNNQIHALPDTFGQLSKLTKLSLEENPLVIPPKEVVSQGVGAIRAFMAKRHLEILAEEEQKSMLEVKEQTETDWLTRSSSWLNNFVSGVSGRVSEYLGTDGNSPKDPCLNQQL